MTDAKDRRIADHAYMNRVLRAENARLTARIAELEAERDTAFDEWTRTMEVNRGLVAERDRLIRAGDVLATRLDETPVPSLFGFEDLDKAKEQQQAVRAWLALAHPDGEGHATEIGERGEVSGATWESATE